MKLTIASASVPAALIPLAAVADVVGVDIGQAAAWCESGQLTATSHLGHWWVSVGDLSAFVERSTWKLVGPPPDKRYNKRPRASA
jgi:hypothetical protein